MDIGVARHRKFGEGMIKRAFEWRNSTRRSANINSVQVERVICIKMTEGTGTETDPFQESKRFFTFTGAYIGVLGRNDESYSDPNLPWDELEKAKRQNFEGSLFCPIAEL